MTIGTWLAVAAMFVALLSFIGTELATHRTASSEYVDQLEARVKKLEDDLAAKNTELAQKALRVIELEGENLRLMVRLLANGKAVP